MPIYMDLHKYPKEGPIPSRQDLFNAHKKDLMIQEKYGVHNLFIIANLEEGAVFCVMEAPSPESCIAVHREAHGDVPCHIIEVKLGDVWNFIGQTDRKDEVDILQLANGYPDSGYRIVLAADYISLIEKDEFLPRFRTMIEDKAGGSGRNIEGSRVMVFQDADKALDFALELATAFHQDGKKGRQELRIGIAAGMPVNKISNNLYGAAMDLALRFCEVAGNETIVVSRLAHQLMKTNQLFEPEREIRIRILNSDEEEFLLQLGQAIDRLEVNPDFGVKSLAQDMKISPSGLYRKISTLAGISLVSFLQEKRLRRAYEKIRTHAGNIAEIAYETGFSSPSYFTRSFKKRFGISPAEVYRTVSAF